MTANELYKAGKLNDAVTAALDDVKRCSTLNSRRP
jgi:hypothetical protein